MPKKISGLKLFKTSGLVINTLKNELILALHWISTYAVTRVCGGKAAVAPVIFAAQAGQSYSTCYYSTFACLSLVVPQVALAVPNPLWRTAPRKRTAVRLFFRNLMPGAPSRAFFHQSFLLTRKPNPL